MKEVKHRHTDTEEKVIDLLLHPKRLQKVGQEIRENMKRREAKQPKPKKVGEIVSFKRKGGK
jgi:hypothetical protein